MLPRLLSCCGAEARTLIVIHTDNVSLWITGGRTIPGGRRLASASLVTARRGRILLPGRDRRARGLDGEGAGPRRLLSPGRVARKGAAAPVPLALATASLSCVFSTLLITITCTCASKCSRCWALLACRSDRCNVFFQCRKHFFHAEHSTARTAQC